MVHAHSIPYSIENFLINRISEHGIFEHHAEGRLLGVGGRVRVGNGPFRSMDGVRVHELDRNSPAAVRQGYFLEDLAARVGFEDGIVPDLLALIGSPPQELCSAGIIAGFV
jgi:hypothetical protein